MSVDGTAGTCTQQANVGIVNSNIGIGTVPRLRILFPEQESTSLGSLTEFDLPGADITVCKSADEAIDKSKDAFVVEGYRQNFGIVLLSSVARLEADVGALASSSAATKDLRPMNFVADFNDGVDEVKIEEKEVEKQTTTLDRQASKIVSLMARRKTTQVWCLKRSLIRGRNVLQ